MTSPTHHWNLLSILEYLPSSISQRPPKEAALMTAVGTHDLPTIRELLRDAEIDINWQDPSKNHWTFLHLAVVTNSPDTIKLIRDTRAIEVDLVPADDFGRTPFHLAVELDHPLCIRALALGTRYFICQHLDREHFTPMMRAILLQRNTCIRYLVAYVQDSCTHKPVLTNHLGIGITDTNGKVTELALLNKVFLEPEVRKILLARKEGLERDDTTMLPVREALEADLQRQGIRADGTLPPKPALLKGGDDPKGNAGSEATGDNDVVGCDELDDDDFCVLL